MKSTLRNMTMSLGILVILAAAALAGIKLMTDSRIADAAHRARLDAFTQILGKFDNNPAEGAITLDNGTTVYPATLNGSPAGAAVEISATGFGGPFSLMAGFDADGAVTGYTILSHSETPGLGSKMDAWFADHSHPERCIIGRRPEGADGGSGASRKAHDAHQVSGILSVSKDGGDIDAITGATITSRAFLQAINEAAEAFKETQSKQK